MKSKISLGMCATVLALSLSSHSAFAQFFFVPGGQGGRTLPQVQVIGIGNFPNLANVQSVLHVNSNLTNTPTFISRGEVFRTDAPAGFTTWRMLNGGITNGIISNLAGNNHFSLQANSGDMTFHAGGATERMRITAFGNVGIGTSAPTEKIHVQNGNIYVDGEGRGVIVNAGGNQRVGFMKYAFREAGIWRTPGQDFEIGRLLQGTLTSPLSKPFNHFATDIYIAGNGRVAINFPIASTSPVPPGNRLTINSDTTADPKPAGLRFINLTSASATEPANGKVLSVDVNGDVILVPVIGSSGNIVVPATGYKTLNYSEFIPFLIKSIQEQQTQIDSLKNQLASIQSCINSFPPGLCGNNGGSMLKTSGTTTGGEGIKTTNIELASANVILYQNEPNPFNGQTTIRYFIPENIIHAEMVFYDEFGKELQKVQLTEKGYERIEAATAHLATGIYTYSIVTDSKVADTKKMIRNR